MTIPIASTLEALLAPGARHRNDRSTFSDLRVDRRGDAPPPGIEVEWLGTAAFRIRYEGFTLLVDPYLSRPGLAATLSRKPLRPREDRIRRHVPEADGILVGHTHFDHALDVPAIARASGAKVYGSRSCGALLRCRGLPDQVAEVVPGRPFDVGPFVVTFVPSVHSKLVLGLAVPFDGELSCDHLDDLRGSAYRCGDVFGIHIRAGGTTFYHQGSANLLDAEVVHRGVDYFLCCIAGRGYTERYAERILRKLEPRVVVPHHFDDFFRPLGAEMGFSLNVNLGGFVEEVRRVSSDFVVRTLPLAEAWGAGRLTGSS